MPFYEFECPKNHITVVLVPVGTKVVVCEQCKSDAQRILSPVPTTFKHAGGRKP